VEGAALVGGWDPDPDRRRLFADRWAVPTDFDGPESLLQAVAPDVLVVATWPESHAALVELACTAKIPVVVCEKPLTNDLGQARRLVGRVSRSSTRVMVNHERRYARDYRRVREVIQGCSYGPLVTVSAKLFMGRGRTPGEVLLWDGTHLLDVLRFLTGAEIAQVRSWGNPGVKGSSLTTRFRLGATEVFVETASNRDHLVFELDLSFERGRIRIGNGLYEEFVGGVSPLYDSMRSLLPVAVDASALYPTNYFLGMAEDAVRAAREPSYQPVSAVRDGLAALQAIDQILRSAGSSLKRVSRSS
jgi:predicted dehydrogenase